MVFFVKQKTAYEMRISDWSSDVCSSDLAIGLHRDFGHLRHERAERLVHGNATPALLALGTRRQRFVPAGLLGGQLQRTAVTRSEERRFGKECVCTFRSRLSP